MADDSTTAPVAFDPDQITAMLQRLGVQPPTQAPTPTEGGPGTHGVAGFLSDVGTVLGGGPTGLLGLSPDEQSASGRHALLNFGINMLAASGKSYAPKDFGTVLAAGLGGAQQAQQESENRAFYGRGATQQLAQQAFQNRLSAIKTALPLLTAQLDAQGLANARQIAGGGGKPGTSISDFTGDKAKDLALIKQRESGGDYNILNYVAKEDPTAYDRGATASGAYQIVNSTWREGMQLAGLDPSKYATARDAPAAVQDQVASALYDKYGTKPWQKGARDWVKDEQGHYQLATVRPPAGSPGGTPATAPAAPVTPPGVQVGGAPPPPPGGSTTAAGPPAVGGIGAALQLPTKGSPVPSGKLLTSDVGAIQAGMQAARTGPRPPTALTAGPGAPTQTATATPNAPEAGWGSKIPSSYSDSPAVTAPAAAPVAAPATVTPPAGPVRVPDAPPAYVRGALPPDIQSRIDNPPVSDDLTKALQEARQTRDISKITAAQAAIGAAKDTARAAAQKDAETYHTQQQSLGTETWKVRRAEQQANDKAEADRQATAALKTQEGKQAIDLANANAGISERAKVLEGIDTDTKIAKEGADQLQVVRSLSKGAGQPGILNSVPAVRDWLVRIGAASPEEVSKWSAQDALDGATNRLMSVLRNGTGFSRTTNMDLGFLEKAGPGGSWTPEQFREARLAFLMTAFAHQQKYSALVHSHVSAGKSLPEAYNLADADPQVGPVIPQMPGADKLADGTSRTKWAFDNVGRGAFYKDAGGNLRIFDPPEGAKRPE